MTVPYTDARSLKGTLGVEDEEPETNAVLFQVALDAARIINEFCNRDFALYQETRTFDAPPSERLLVADLRAVTSILWFGSILVANTDYLLVSRSGPADYQVLLRLYSPGLMPVSLTYRWDLDPATKLPRGLPWGALGVSGVWAYQATQDPVTHTWSGTIPDKILRASEILCVRLWGMRELLYSAGGGAGGNLGRRGAPGTLLDTTLHDLLNSYVLDSMPRRVGSPYGD